MHYHQGFTVLEALTVMAVTCLMLAIGVPALQSLVRDAAMTTSVNDLVRALHAARRAANARGINVVVCASDGAGRCLYEMDWQRGWVSYADYASGTGGQPDAGDLVLAAREVGSDLKITANRQAFRFTPFTRRDTNGSISFCDQRGRRYARLVVVSPTGRPRLASSEETQSRVKC